MKLPSHFFKAKANTTQRPRALGFFTHLAVRFSIPILIEMSQNAFNEEDFLEGSKLAFDHIMGQYIRGSVGGFDALMSERVMIAFRETLEEYE